MRPALVSVRALVAIVAVVLIAASCSSGGSSGESAGLDAAQADTGSGAATDGSAIPISGPASAPAAQPDELINPPNVNALSCDQPRLDDGITGFPDRVDEWAVIGVDETRLVEDGGQHPGGWRYITLPDRMEFRPGAEASRMLSADDLTELDVPQGTQRDIGERLFSTESVVASLVSLDRGAIEELLIPLDRSQIYGGWSTTIVLALRSDGSFAVAGHCPEDIERGIVNALAAARDIGMQGGSVDILTRLSVAEITGLAAGDY